MIYFYVLNEAYQDGQWTWAVYCNHRTTDFYKWIFFKERNEWFCLGFLLLLLFFVFVFIYIFNRNGCEWMMAVWMLWAPVSPVWPSDCLTGGHCHPHLNFQSGTLTRDQKLASSSPGRRGERISSRVNFLCWLLFDVRSTFVLPQLHVKDPCHSTKSARGKLHLNTHTSLTQQSQSGLTMPSRHNVRTH